MTKTRRLYKVVDEIFRMEDHQDDAERRAYNEIECTNGVSIYDKARIAEYFGINWQA